MTTELIVLSKLLIARDTSHFKFMIPGAIHKAPWMTKILCGYKLELLKDMIMKELPPGTIFQCGSKLTRRFPQTDRGQQENLVMFIKFIMSVYVPWWVICGPATDLAEHDFVILKVINEYKAIHA